jgi:hypothetical protein
LVWLVWPVGCEPRRLPLVAFVLAPIALSLVADPDPVALFARAFVHGLCDEGWISSDAGWGPDGWGRRRSAAHQQGGVTLTPVGV